jgi:HEAT repeat protein
MDGLRRVAVSAPETAATAIAALLHLGLNPATRERVLQLLSSLPARAVPALTGELAARAPGIRGIGVEVLARMRTPEATEHVAAALADPDASVRALAVNAFGRLGSSGIAERIVAMSHDDPDASVRRRATVVCRRYGWMPGTRAVGTT